MTHFASQREDRLFKVLTSEWQTKAQIAEAADMKLGIVQDTLNSMARRFHIVKSEPVNNTRYYRLPTAEDLKGWSDHFGNLARQKEEAAAEKAKQVDALMETIRDAKRQLNKLGYVAKETAPVAEPDMVEVARTFPHLDLHRNITVRTPKNWLEFNCFGRSNEVVGASIHIEHFFVDGKYLMDYIAQRKHLWKTKRKYGTAMRVPPIKALMAMFLFHHGRSVPEVKSILELEQFSNQAIGELRPWAKGYAHQTKRKAFNAVKIVVGASTSDECRYGDHEGMEVTIRRSPVAKTEVKSKPTTVPVVE